MKQLYLFLAMAFIGFLAGAQPRYVRCGADEYLKMQISQDPERGRRLEALEKRVQEYVTARAAATAAPDQKGKPGSNTPPRDYVVYVPVVVHVLYNTAGQNISDRQVQSQIDVLNDDYSAANQEITAGNKYFAGYDSRISNVKIQFCLAQTKRVATYVTTFAANDAMKHKATGGSDAVNPDTHLNIWVCNLGNDLLGYAQFPGGNLQTDGVVILYSAFGSSIAGATADPYDEGRTATHEIGHWFGLRHIWGDRRCGDDYVGDTPPHDAANFNCPGEGHLSLCRKPELEMWMNYMDYTEDLCMYMFSSGQKVRMDGFIFASRAAYCSTVACPVIGRQPAKAAVVDAGYEMTALQVFPTVVQTKATLMLQSRVAGMADIRLMSQSGVAMQRQRLQVPAGQSNHTLLVDGLRDGMYLISCTLPDGTVLTRKMLVQH